MQIQLNYEIYFNETATSYYDLECILPALKAKFARNNSLFFSR